MAKTSKSNNDALRSALGDNPTDVATGKTPKPHPVQHLDVTASSVRSHIEHALKTPIDPGLYLVATPIGNLSDITLRALQVLVQADVIYCEDTRHSQKLLQHFAIRAVLKPYHEHNAARQRPVILKALADGARIALVSDAGTPLISDPGFKIVRDAIEAGRRVVSIPGASASLVAATVSGLPTDTLLFAGFLPAKDVSRRKRIAALGQVDATLIFYEAPHRLGETLQSMFHELGDRNVCIARELTKIHEECRRGTLAELVGSGNWDEVRGECVILVGPPDKKNYSDEELTEKLQSLLQTMSLKDAARSLADTTRVNKGRIYDLGLILKRES